MKTMSSNNFNIIIGLYIFQEHKCVLDSCRALEGEGFKITYLPVKENGIIDMKELEKALTPETSLVSIMTVNNEIGNIKVFNFLLLLARSLCTLKLELVLA